MGKFSREKGKRGELEVAALLTSSGYEASRGAQHEGGPDSPDVRSPDFPFHVEVKKTEKLSLYKAMEQSASDAEGSGKPPIVFHRRNRKPWLVVMRWQDLRDVFLRSSIDEQEEVQSS